MQYVSGSTVKNLFKFPLMKRLPAWIQGVFYYMEIFKDIKGYEGLYQVSNFGRVKSLKRKGCLKDRILSSGTSHGGYYQVILYKDSKSKNCHVHKLVAIAFLGHEPNGHNKVVDHVDNNPKNNNVNNLQLITQRENTSKDKKGYTSEYIGVYFHKRDKLFRAVIKIKGKVVHLGSFKDELKAAEAYQNALKNL